MGDEQIVTKYLNVLNYLLLQNGYNDIYVHFILTDISFEQYTYQLRKGGS